MDNDNFGCGAVLAVCLTALLLGGAVGIGIGARLTTEGLTSRYCQQLGWEGGDRHSMCYTNTDAGKYQCELSLVIEGLCEVPETVEGDHE